MMGLLIPDSGTINFNSINILEIVAYFKVEVIDFTCTSDVVLCASIAENIAFY